MPDTDLIPPISHTAFYCCGLREKDARSRFPVANDIYAAEFMTPGVRRVFEKYRPNHFEKGLNCTRVKIIDNLLARSLKQNPDLSIVLIGAGFDSRAFRIAGGHWLEIDEAGIIHHKEKHLPAALCPNPLRRVRIDYAKDSLEELLRKNDSGREVLYLVEGVFMYLEIEEIKSLLSAIRANREKHVLVCDLMTNFFVRVFAGAPRRKFCAMGAEIKCQTNRPESLFLDHGYQLSREVSVFQTAAHYGAVMLPGIFLLPGMKTGYRVFRFSAS